MEIIKIKKTHTIAKYKKTLIIGAENEIDEKDYIIEINLKELLKDLKSLKLIK